MFKSLPKRPLVLAALAALASLAITAVAYAALPGTPVGPRFSCPSGTLVAIGDQVSCRVDGAGPQTTQSTDAVCPALLAGAIKSGNPDGLYASRGRCYEGSASCNEVDLMRAQKAAQRASVPECPAGQVCSAWQVAPQQGPNDRGMRAMCVRTASAAGFVAPVAK
jgi:hypothetical protein